jgi:hypothetical protein
MPCAAPPGAAQVQTKEMPAVFRNCVNASHVFRAAGRVNFFIVASKKVLKKA